MGQKIEGRDAILEAVAKMEPGTRFTETDGIGRKHSVMAAFSDRVIFDNGTDWAANYDGVDEDASIVITHVPSAVEGEGVQILPETLIQNPPPLGWPWASPGAMVDDPQARIEELHCGCYSRVDNEKVLCPVHLAALNGSGV